MPVLHVVKPTRVALTALGLSLIGLPAMAAMPTAADIQTQLQDEWSDFTSRVGSNTNSGGKVAVTQDGNAYNATLPPLSIPLQANNVVKLDAIKVVATPSAAGNVNLKITLPNPINQYYGTQQTGAMTIAKQDLNIAVKPAGDTWQVQSVDGQLGGVNWKQNENITTNPVAPMQASISQLSLTGKPSQLNLKASGITAKDVGGDTQSIGQMTLTQQPSTPQSLRLSDVLVLLTDTLPQIQNGNSGLTAWLEGAASMTADIRNMKNVDGNGKTTLAFDNMVLKNALAGIVDNKLTMRTTGAVNGITLALPAAFADTAPTKLDFTSTVRNLPIQYFSMPFNTPEAQTRARAALAAAKTQLQIDSLNIATKGDLKASGNGLLTATTTGPTYTTGNITLNISNLQQTMQKLQQKRSPAQSQTLMALMLLQGMGRPSTTDASLTQYLVNLTPAGGVTVNDQDLSGILALAGLSGKPANTGRAIPIAPVTTEQTTPLSTPWKQ